MRAIAIILVLASFPFFIYILRSRSARPWIFLIFGALPVLFGPLNLDAALVNWPTWPGHTKGLSLTFVDTLAWATCLRYSSQHRTPPLLWVSLLYVSCLLPGLLVSSIFQPAFFYVFQAVRASMVVYATYLIIQNGHLTKLAQGLAVGVILNCLVALRDSLAGTAQAPGLLGHQNLSGMAVNLCVPLLLALGLQKKGAIFLMAAGAGGLSAIAGGSRASILLYGVAVSATLLGCTVLNPNRRKTVFLIGSVLGLLALSPLALSKLAERSPGGTIELTIDGERLAFERAAGMMIDDYPMGVGLNQYVTIANVGGYLDRAGVRWGYEARSTNVHNTYLLTRVEGGLIALAGFLIWLLAPLCVALKLAFRKKTQLREISWAIAVAIGVTALHGRFEWVLVTVVPQYLVAMLIGMVAAVAASERNARKLRKEEPVLARKPAQAVLQGGSQA